MAQVRGTFAALYDNVDKVVKSVIRDALKEQPPIWREYFNVLTSQRKFERVQTVTGFSDVPEKPEGETYALDLIKPGYSKDFTHVEFGLGFEVTETALEDDQYDQLVRASEWLAFAARYVEEQRAARIHNNGFTTETTPDGVSLYNTAHVLKGGGTAKNRPSTDADLDVDSLEQALIDISTDTKLESGQIVQPPDSLILEVPPALEFTADRIIFSKQLAMTAGVNDKNPFDRRRWQLIVNPHFSDSDAWRVVFASKRMHGLTSYTRVPITMVPPAQDPFTGNRIYKIRFRRSWGAWMWQGTYASAGA